MSNFSNYSTLKLNCKEGKITKQFESSICNVSQPVSGGDVPRVIGIQFAKQIVAYPVNIISTIVVSSNQVAPFSATVVAVPYAFFPPLKIVLYQEQALREITLRSRLCQKNPSARSFQTTLIIRPCNKILE